MSQNTLYPGVDVPARRKRNLLDRLFRDTAYTLTALPIGILTFTVVVTGLSAGVSLVVVWVGLPILIGTLIATRGFAHLERIRLRTLQDRAAPTPEYVVADDDAGTLRRLLTPLRDPQSWVDTAWGIVSFVTGIIAFVVTVTWWAIAAGGLTYWFWEQWLPRNDDDHTLAGLIGLGDGRSPDIWLNLAIGVVAAPAAAGGPRGHHAARRPGRGDAQRPAHLPPRVRGARRDARLRRPHRPRRLTGNRAVPAFVPPPCAWS